MNRKTITGLCMLCVLFIVLLINTGGEIEITFKVFSIKAARPIMLFVFSAIGVAIGLLLR